MCSSAGTGRQSIFPPGLVAPGITALEKGSGLRHSVILLPGHHCLYDAHQHQPIDLLSQQPDLVQVKLTNLSNSIREIICLISQNAHHRSEIGWPLSKDDSKLTEVPAQRIDELGAVAHEAMVRSERHRTRLMFSALDCNVVHVRP